LFLESHPVQQVGKCSQEIEISWVEAYSQLVDPESLVHLGRALIAGTQEELCAPEVPRPQCLHEVRGKFLYDLRVFPSLKKPTMDF
jgi:hypothetical protein